MNKKKTLAIVLGGILVLAFAACKRDNPGRPSPVGPSSMAHILKVSASPNVLTATSQRQYTRINASLKKFDGTPLAGKAITFKVADATGASIAVGYFEGSGLVKTMTTDGSGNASLTYFGPLSSELAAPPDVPPDISVYIFASVAMEGSEFIQGFSRIDIIANPSVPVLAISANPTVLTAGTTRQSSLVTASLKMSDGTPIANKTVVFEINDESDVKKQIGYFDKHKYTVSLVTDSNGNASVRYFAPTHDEVRMSLIVHIWVNAALDGDYSPSGFIPIYIIR